MSRQVLPTAPSPKTEGCFKKKHYSLTHDDGFDGLHDLAEAAERETRIKSQDPSRTKTDSVCVSMMNRKTRLQPPFQSGACGE
jgi:hypothetical protein